jgi:hypothetical protein
MALQPDILQKLPPQSVEVEQSVLGAVLLDQEALVRVLDVINERDFYQDVHRWIFQSMVELFEDNVPIDVITVAERLKKKRTARGGGRGGLPGGVSGHGAHVCPRVVSRPNCARKGDSAHSDSVGHGDRGR